MTLPVRDARFDEIVQALRDRAVDDRLVREKRQRWYKQHLKIESAAARDREATPHRLERFRTRVPCSITPAAQALLGDLAHRFSGCAVSFTLGPSGNQSIVLTVDGSVPRRIGWVEHCVVDDGVAGETRRGLSVETDDGRSLVLRLRYAATPTRVRVDTASADAAVTFTEILQALDPQPADKGPLPRLVWVTRPPEIATMNALQSRDYEAFYVRFKLEVLAGIWNALLALLAAAPASHWHDGAYYSVLCDADATTARVHQRTVDDTGQAIDLGLDRIYDASCATDIALLYLDGDLLADIADIYFTLKSLASADSYFLKEEFFTFVRRFWASAQSLPSRYGSDVATVLRMSLRAVPMPAQAPLLRQDWTNLRQALVDRYGEGGAKAADHANHEGYRPRMAPLAWPFASFAPGEVNVGLRMVYRQQWRAPSSVDGEARQSGEVVGAAVNAAVAAMRWPLDAEGAVNTGVRALAGRTNLGLDAEPLESVRDTTSRLSDIMHRIASRGVGGAADAARVDLDIETRLAEVENVVLVAEKLPTPPEIDISWVRRHESVVDDALLDESLRDVLGCIRAKEAVAKKSRDRLCEHLRANILHYQRAIWAQEDPQQRGLRYRKARMKMPLEWRFALEPRAGLTIDQLSARLSAPAVDGQFAAYSTGRNADLDQVIDASGPIGYFANYAIYRMRPEFGRADLFAMLHFFKSPYVPAPGIPAVVAEDPAAADTVEEPQATVDEVPVVQALSLIVPEQAGTAGGPQSGTFVIGVPGTAALLSTGSAPPIVDNTDVVHARGRAPDVRIQIAPRERTFVPRDDEWLRACPVAH